MKNLSTNALRLNSCNFRVALFICPLVFIVFALGCKKEMAVDPLKEMESTTLTMKSNSIAANKVDGNVVNDYTGLSQETKWELQQARAATAKYRNIEHAIKDGYVDIGVDVEGMGHHYMKASLVDETFNIREPEILVYNRNEDGVQELLAVEYAVTKTSSMAPEGFSGSSDVWDGNTAPTLWLLHAWVWRYNPAGVFNPTNPTVHLH